MSVSTRSCRPPSSISWWLESGRGLGAEIDTFSCHIESGLKKTNNCQGTRVFPIILYMSVENTIPWENSDSHLMKSKGTWGGCIIVTHKDLEELWRLRLLPTPAWAEWCLVFRLSSCTMLGNVVWPYILKTTLCMVLGLGPCLFPFALTSGGPSCAKIMSNEEPWFLQSQGFACRSSLVPLPSPFMIGSPCVLRLGGLGTCSHVLKISYTLLLLLWG